MSCQMRQSGFAYVAVSVFLFSLCGLSVGCARSTSRSFEDDKDKRVDASGDSDAESDASDSVPPSHRSDSGQSDGPNPPFEADAGRIKCRVDSECPSDDPCEQGICSRSGFCTTESVPDGTPCTTTSAGSRICLDGVCQISRCGDAFVDRNAGESCEDGNSDTGDGCALCQVAFCGDGFIQRGVEDCDPLNDDYCNADCERIVCGDGVIDEPIENCEPDISDDPCNEECRISDNPEWTVVLQPQLQMAMFAVLLLDSNGNPIVAAAGGESIGPSIGTRIYKFQNDGDEIWTVEFEEDVSVTAALDNDDNIVVLGGDETGRYPWIAKIDSDGEVLWSVHPSESMQVFTGVAIDSEADIMALAVSPLIPLPNSYGIWLGGTPSLAFISANGDYNSDSDKEIEGYYALGRALNSGSIDGVRCYLLAGIVEKEGLYEPLLTLVESGGEPVWDTPINYSVPDERAGFVQAVAISDGDIIGLGVSYSIVPATPFGGIPDNSFLWLQRYSPEGEPRWDDRKKVRFNDPLAILGTGSFPVVPFAMAIDGQDNIYISAHNSGQNGIEEFISIDKYDSNGEPVWKSSLHHEGTSQQYPLGLAVDDSGAIYLLAADSVEQSSSAPPMTPPMTPPMMYRRYILYKWEQPDW